MVTRYEPATRQRAVRMVAEVAAEHPQLSQAAVVDLVAGELEVNASTLRGWVRAGVEATYGPVRKALETTLSSDPKLSTDRHAALVGLCRMVADQVDMAGSACPVNLTAAYLSAIKDLQRAMSATADGKPTTASKGTGAGKKSNDAGKEGAGDNVGSVTPLDKVRAAREGQTA